MNVDTTILFGVITVALAVAGFYIGRITAVKKDTREEAERESASAVRMAQVENDISHIKTMLDKMDGRLDEISTQLMNVASTATSAMDSTKSAHKRLDDMSKTIDKIREEK